MLLGSAQKKPTRSGSIRVGPDFFNFIGALTKESRPIQRAENRIHCKSTNVAAG